MAEPFDLELLGAHASLSCTFLVKAIERKSDERMGVLVREEGKLRVIEYFEFPGSANSFLGYTGLFSVRINEIHFKRQPLHKSDKEGYWKFEKFIFDLFPRGEAKVMVVPRENHFAPLKNKTGFDCPTTVQEALFAEDSRTYTTVTGLPAPKHPFELSPRYRLEQPRKTLPDQPYIE